MDRFKKIAEIRAVGVKETKRIAESLENAGFVICTDKEYNNEPYDIIVMEKTTSNES